MSTTSSAGTTGGASTIDAALADLQATYQQIAAQNLAIGKAQLEGRQLTQRAKAVQTAGESAPTQ